MRASNNGQDWSEWVAFEDGDYTWRLEGHRVGTKTVQVQYEDSVGNVSDAYGDTIRYAP